MAKRAPIEYPLGTFGGGIFRPKEEVEQELVYAQPDTEDAGVATPHDTGQHGKDRTNDHSNGQASQRARVRHSFDVYQDQLHALADMQASLYAQTGRKPKLGELVQEALDVFIAKHNAKSNDRTNERSQEPLERD